MTPAPGREASPERDDARALELLVLTVTVLDPARAASLLAGLAESLRSAALRECARLEKMGRGGRHAALARSCAPRPTSGAGRAEHLPGLLGAEVRKRLAPGDAGPQGSGPLERWARRLAVELWAQGTTQGVSATSAGPSGPAKWTMWPPFEANR